MLLCATATWDELEKGANTRGSLDGREVFGSDIDEYKFGEFVKIFIAVFRCLRQMSNVYSSNVYKFVCLDCGM